MARKETGQPEPSARRRALHPSCATQKDGNTASQRRLTGGWKRKGRKGKEKRSKSRRGGGKRRGWES